jgi:hypothetical protein
MDKLVKGSFGKMKRVSKRKRSEKVDAKDLPDGRIHGDNDNKVVTKWRPCRLRIYLSFSYAWLHRY